MADPRVKIGARVRVRIAPGVTSGQAMNGRVGTIVELDDIYDNAPAVQVEFDTPIRGAGSTGVVMESELVFLWEEPVDWTDEPGWRELD